MPIWLSEQLQNSRKSIHRNLLNIGISTVCEIRLLEAGLLQQRS